MTVLYRPVLIESVEQAEALPVGTFAISPANANGDTQACIRVEGGWHVTREIENNDQDVIEHALMIGDQALVPIEAEEETVDASTWATPGRTITRLTTRWEEA